jgi:hypothetical protein
MSELPPRPDPVGGAGAAADVVPTADEALAMYRLTTRLVELQLDLADRGRTNPAEVAVTHDVLVGTRQVLLAALHDVDGRPRPPFMGRQAR